MAPSPLPAKRGRLQSGGGGQVVSLLSDSEDETIAHGAPAKTPDWELALRVHAREQRSWLGRLAGERAAEARALQPEQEELQVREKRRRLNRARREREDEVLAWRLQQQEQEELDRLRESMAEERRGSSLAALTTCQRSALDYARARAARLHAAAVEPLARRVAGLGFSRGDLDSCLAYVRDDAPVIVHMREATLPLLVADPVYRSQFETGTSGGMLGGDRAKWEDIMFGQHYRSSQPHERPKYGCLNMTGDNFGVRVARVYGALFMVLKPDVRVRTTFTDRDSSKSDGSDVATSEHYAHVLLRYSDEELRLVLRIARTTESRIRGAASDSFAQYKEAQIHGPVSIRRDVLALSLPGREAEASAELRGHAAAFQALSKCNVLWQSD